jgi:MscS family membrane protein
MKTLRSILMKLYLAGAVLLLAVSSPAQAQVTNAPLVANDSTATVSVSPLNPEKGNLTFWLDRIPQLRTTAMGIPLWQYIATAIYVALALLGAKIFDYIITVQLKRITARTKMRLDDLFVELLHGPVKILAVVLFLHFGFNLFNWPRWVEIWISKALAVLMAVSVTYMILKLVDVAAAYWRNRPSVKTDKTFNDLLIPLISKSLKIFVTIMAILVTLDNLHFEIRTLLAGASISGLALGLAAQDTVGNLFGAAAVFIDKPFRIGDRVQLNGIDGTVEEIGLRSTRIRNLDGHLITVPNKTMGNSTITNISLRPTIKTVMNIGITYDSPTAKVEEAVRILNDIFKAHPMTHDVVIGFNQFGDSALNISVVHWWKGLDNKEYVAGMEALNLAVKLRFDQSGIGFAYPSRTVFLRQEGEWRVGLPGQDRLQG